MTTAVLKLLEEYRRLAGGVINHDFFDQMVLTHHSTAIEGSTLTLAETQTLLEKGRAAGGKPLEHHLMVTDHQRALLAVLGWAEVRSTITPKRLQKLGGLVMASTGGIVNVMAGSFDTSRGDWRLATVRAGSRTFPDARKVPVLVSQFCRDLAAQLPKLDGPEQVYDAAFDVHFALVSIHLFGDGNGRTSRLIMNYVQHYHGQPLSFVFAQDRTAYVEALETSRKSESTAPIRKFLYAQLAKHLRAEIKRLTTKPKSRQSGGFNLLF